MKFVKSYFFLGVTFLVASCGGASSKEISKSVDVGTTDQDASVDEMVYKKADEGQVDQETVSALPTGCQGDEILQAGTGRCWRMCFQGTKQGDAKCEGKSSRYLSWKMADGICRSHRSGCRLPSASELGEVLGSCESEVIHRGNRQCADCRFGDVCAMMRDETIFEIIFWARYGGDSKDTRWKSSIDGIKLYELTNGMRSGFFCVCDPVDVESPIQAV